MHIFKASGDTYESVVANQKHAFVNKPKAISAGDIILLSKNKSGLKREEKQISHYAVFKKIRSCSDDEIESLWPGNAGRWKYITDFSDVRSVDPPFNLNEVLAQDRARHYSFLMTHGKVAEKDEEVILSRISQQVSSYFPEEVVATADYTEGAKRTVTVNAYERDPRAREECLRHHGYVCKVCAFDFEQVYGELGKGYIHVHHIVPLFLRDQSYSVNPVKDLIPVCPNCHAMLHRSNPPMSPVELKEIIFERKP